MNKSAVASLLAAAAVVTMAQPARAASWYYCDSAHAYYPYVSTCPERWREVAPHSSTTAPSANVEQSAPAPIATSEEPPAPKPKAHKPTAKLSRKGAMPATTPPAAPLGSQLTSSELDLVKQQIEACWNPPAGARNAKDITPQFRVYMAQDGTIRSASQLNPERNKDPLFQSVADAAFRALHDPQCQPLELPPEKYDQWQTFTITFDAHDLTGPAPPSEQSQSPDVSPREATPSHKSSEVWFVGKMRISDLYGAWLYEPTSQRCVPMVSFIVTNTGPKAINGADFVVTFLDERQKRVFTSGSVFWTDLGSGSLPPDYSRGVVVKGKVGTLWCPNNSGPPIDPAIPDLIAELTIRDNDGYKTTISSRTTVENMSVPFTTQDETARAMAAAAR